MNLSLGHDGVAWSEVIQVNWSDLTDALQRLLGYSWRDTGGIPSQLRRKLPWQHPFFNQMWVKNVAEVSGIGPPRISAKQGDFLPLEGGIGNGVPLNYGPWADYDRARITVQFWRPPYFVRSDEDVLNPVTNLQQEWLRYVSKKWSASEQVLSRESAQMVWADGNGAGVRGMPGGMGQVVTHQKLTRTWYEVPEMGLFAAAQDATPNGQCQPLVYTRTAVTNPITGYPYYGGPGNYVVGQNPLLGTVNAPIGGGLDFVLTNCHVTAGSPIVQVSSTAGLGAQGNVCTDGTIYGGDMVSSTTFSGIRPGSTIISIGDSTHFTMNYNAYQTSTTATLNFVSDYSLAARMFGCYMGTLRLDHAELVERPLQLPPYLMQIPVFAGNEAISQVQYDVVLHYDLFDPPRETTAANVYPYGASRGHNMMPYPGTGMWRPVNFQNDVNNGTAGPFLTPFQFADHSDAFQIL